MHQMLTECEFGSTQDMAGDLDSHLQQNHKMGGSRIGFVSELSPGNSREGTDFNV